VPNNTILKQKISTFIVSIHIQLGNEREVVGRVCLGDKLNIKLENAEFDKQGVAGLHQQDLA
jgi:hypothetical protein